MEVVVGIGMEFGIEKCVMLAMKSRKIRKKMKEMELPSKKHIRTLGKRGNYMYLGVLEVDTVTQTEMKEKIRKEHLRRIRKLLCSKFHTWSVPFVRYSEPFLKMDKRASQTNEPQNKEVDDCA